MLMCATGAYTHQCTHEEFVDFHENSGQIKNKKHQIYTINYYAVLCVVYPIVAVGVIMTS